MSHHSGQEAPKAMLKNRDELPVITLDDSLPFVDKGTFKIQLLHVSIDTGTWVIRTFFSPGTQIQKHKHTGEIYAFTHSGSWYYLEYPDDVNVEGSYLYEPACSTHTLCAPESNTEETEVVFVMNGANLNLDDNDEVASILDAQTVIQVYLEQCEKQGFDKPDVLGYSE